MNDPIADMIIRIKNALMARHETVAVPHSRVKEEISKILVANNYVESYEVSKKMPQSDLVFKLRYVGKVPAITDVRRISTPGRRVYSTSAKVPKALGGYGITIVSTSKGVMTDKDARKQNVGGEVLCQIW
ncbi:30S ribosomal protein S8 [Patescibacteria group bacterium]|nr:30S ribosomal protein S8 [Patescibacteria group bacterium]